MSRYVADDADAISKRLKELEAEKQSVLSQPLDEPGEEAPAEEQDAVAAYWAQQAYDPWKKLAEDLAGKRGPAQPVEPSGYTIIKISDDEWKLVRLPVI